MNSEIDLSSWTSSGDSPSRKAYLKSQQAFLEATTQESTVQQENSPVPQQNIPVPMPTTPAQDPTGLSIHIIPDLRPVIFQFRIGDSKLLTVKVTVISCNDLDDSISFVTGDTVEFGFPKLEPFNVILDSGANYKVIFAGGQIKLNGYKIISLLKAE